MSVKSNGSKISSALRPTRAASTSKELPYSDTWAVFETIRTADHKNASCRSAGDGSAGGPPARKRSSGVAFVSEWTWWW